MLFKNLFPGFLSVLTLCHVALGGTHVVAAEVQSVFTVQAPEGRWIVRALTTDKLCPSISWDQKNPTLMQVRAPQAVEPVRSDVVQSDSKPSVFDVMSCESVWPDGAKSASVAGQVVPPPAKSIQRILIIADTGCRLKASEKAFQDCNDADKWPFAKIAKSAALLKPDLVVHIGDIHYRESPCPDGNAGCAGATWGYGWDAWRDDFFSQPNPYCPPRLGCLCVAIMNLVSGQGKDGSVLWMVCLGQLAEIAMIQPMMP